MYEQVIQRSVVEAFLRFRGHTISSQDTSSMIHSWLGGTSVITFWDEVKDMSKYTQKHPADSYIYIYVANRHGARKSRNKQAFIEFIEYWRLLVNPCLHEWVPHHERIQASELPQGLSEHQLPVLLETDAVSIWKYFKRGDIVRVVRKGVEDGNVMFRRVE